MSYSDVIIFFLGRLFMHTKNMNCAIAADHAVKVYVFGSCINAEIINVGIHFMDV